MSVLLASRNLRDLGGLPTTDGRTIAPQRLYRSGHLAELDADELAVLRGLGLVTIVDLRRPEEIEQRPTPHLGATTVNISPNHGDSEFAVQAARIAEGHEDSDIDLDAFPRGYRQMALDPYRIEKYREVVLTLAAAEQQPALFHCTAGKDRTGWTAAILLTMAGVHRAVIMEDYLRTNEVRAQHNRVVMEQRRRQLAERRGTAVREITDDDLLAVRSLLEVSPVYLNNSFAAVEEQFGDFDTYRRDVLLIDDAVVEAFREGVLV